MASKWQWEKFSTHHHPPLPTTPHSWPEMLFISTWSPPPLHTHTHPLLGQAFDVSVCVLCCAAHEKLFQYGWNCFRILLFGGGEMEMAFLGRRARF